jgi:hypothetical protein
VMLLLPVDPATRTALARHLRFARRMARLHLIAGRDGLMAEIAAGIAWQAAAQELRTALQIARLQEAERRQRDAVTGIDHGRD